MRKGEQIMFIMFEKDSHFHKTSDNQFIKTASVVIGAGIVVGRYSEENREILSKAVAEFLHEYRKNPITLDISSYSYIEARAILTLIKEGMEYPNMDVIDMFATILGIYMNRVDEEA